MRFTHFQVTFHQARICIPPVSLRGRRANAHLLVTFNAWTRLMKFSLPVGHNCKHLKSTSVRHLIALFEITTRSHHWETAKTREWGSCSNMASDSVRLGPTNYEDSTPEWASDTFAYRSPNKNPFLHFAYPRVKNVKRQRRDKGRRTYGLQVIEIAVVLISLMRSMWLKKEEWNKC